MNQPIEFYFWAIPLALATLAAGGYALKHLLFGRFVGDEPVVCRRCKYDLAGLTSSICPECGRDLDRPRATRKGVRVRSPIRITAGVAGAVALITGGGMFEGFLRQTLNRELEFAPSRWLVRVASTDARWRRQNNAAVLLMSRIRQGNLGNRDLDRIVRTLLAESRRDLGGESRSRFFADWKVYFEEARSRGIVSEQDYRGFLLNLVVLAVEPTAHTDGSVEVTLALWSDTAANERDLIPPLFRSIRVMDESGSGLDTHIRMTSHAMCCEVVSRATVRLAPPTPPRAVTINVEMNILDPRTREILDETWTVDRVILQNGAPVLPSAHWRRGDSADLSPIGAALLTRPFGGVP